MTGKSWVNGQSAARVATNDRGLHYGDGVFTTALVDAGRVVYLHDHLERLQRDARALGFAAPSRWLLQSEFETAAAGQPGAVIKYLLTRGPAERGYRAPAAAQVTRLVLRDAAPRHPQRCWTQGIRLHVCAQRLGVQPRLAGIKHLNRLEQVLARSEWQSEAEEGLMLALDGAVISGTMSNLFFVRGGCLHTPMLDNAGVAGVMRARVLAATAELAIPVLIARYTLADLLAADEVFMTNAVIGLWPVAACAGRLWPRQRALTARLNDALEHPFQGIES